MKNINIIAQLIKNGNYQSIGDDECSYFLSINLEDGEDENLAMEEISRLVENGYTSGVCPSWDIEL